MTIEAVREVGERLGIAPACAALGLAPATYYRRAQPKPAPGPPGFSPGTPARPLCAASFGE